MRNFEFGTKVRAFTKLGLQKEPRWIEGIYLDNNTVEFRTGVTRTLEDKHIKRLDRLENSEAALKQFITKSWEDLKKIISDSMLKFFPDKKIKFDEKEYFISCDNYSIAPVVVEAESFIAFTEICVWQLGVEVYHPGSYWDPPDSDFQELKNSASETNIAGHLLNRIWEDTVESYWENISYSKMAEEEANSNLE